MSITMDGKVKRWTAKRQSALVIEIIQGKTSVSEASRSYDLSPSEIEGWVEDAKRGMENSLRANPLDIHAQYEKQLKDLQEAYGEAMLELRAPIAKLCAWFGVPRRTVYYRPTKSAPKVDPRFAEPIKAMIEKEPVRFTSEVQHLLLWQVVWERDIDTLICGNAARFAVFRPRLWYDRQAIEAILLDDQPRITTEQERQRIPA